MSTALFIAPWPPDPDGGGGARRCFQTLRAFTQVFDEVHLLVTGTEPRSMQLGPAALALPASVTLVHTPHPLATRLGSHALHALNRKIPVPRAVLATLPGDLAAGDLAFVRRLVPVAPGGFDRIHVLRLSAAPLSIPFAQANPGARLTLDVDDIESTFSRRLADLYRAGGERWRARLTDAAVRRREREEATWLPRFHRVYACSTLDRDQLRARFPRVDVARLPNTYDAPAGPPPDVPRAADGRVRLLFVGSLGFAPNDDALRFLATEILPWLPSRVEVHLAGAHLGAATGALFGGRAIRHGWVRDLAPLYAMADVVIAPLRAGSGTRIKILEAFAHERPVVSTAIGAEGLAVRHERDLLLADTPEDFAAQCLRVAADGALAGRLVASAGALVRTRYAPSVLPDLIG